MSRKNRGQFIQKNSDAGIPTQSPATASERPDQILDLREVGATGLKRFSGWVLEEFLPELTGWKGVAVYREMSLNDPTVSAVLSAIKLLCRRVKWFSEAASKNAADQDAAEFLETCMNDMSNTWIDTIDEILSMLEYGYSVQEIVYKRRNGDTLDSSGRSKYKDGRIGWRRLPIRSQDTIYRWHFDNHGGIEGVEQLAPPTYIQAVIPVEKFLLFRTTTFKNDPHGRSILRAAYRCFSADTELLTQNGWKLVGDITTDDTVATLNRDSGKTEFESPSETQSYFHQGEMVLAHSRYVDQLVTPNHRMWVRRAHKEDFEFIEAAECKPSVNFTSRVDYDRPGLKEVRIAGETCNATDWCMFLGLWLAEGSTSRQKGFDCGEVNVCQKSGAKADEVREILAKLPWSFSERSESTSGMVRWRHYRKDLFTELAPLGSARKKYIPRYVLENASRAELEALLAGYYLGDGGLLGGDGKYAGTKRVATASDQLADDLMEAALKCGHRATKRWHASNGFSGGRGGFWMVVFGKHFTDRMKTTWSSVEYAGEVFCVTTKNGVVLSRRNGKASWSGNSWYLKKNIENIEAIGIERDLVGLPMALVPPELLSQNASQAQKATLAAIKDMTINVRRNSQEGMVFPQAYDQNTGKPLYDFKLLSTGGTRQFNTTEIINRYDQRIAMTALADFILLGQDKVGSFALASSKTNLFSTAIGAFLDIVAEVFNRYAIPRLFALNDFKITGYPKLKHGDLGSVDLNELGNYIQKLAQAGMPLFPNDALQKHLMEIAGMPATLADLDQTSTFPVDMPDGGGSVKEIADDAVKPAPSAVDREREAALATASFPPKKPDFV